MQKEKFISLLQNPNVISKKQIAGLQEVIAVFPYFQSARVLQLKGLKKQHSFLYNNALKTTAAYTTNRTVLFDFITSENRNEKFENNNDNKQLSQIDLIDVETIEPNLPTEQSNNNLNQETETQKAKKILDLDKPIHFDKSDSFSFNEWLKLSTEKTKVPLKRNENTDKKNIETKKNASNKNKSKLDLIEKFLETKPKIKPVKKAVTIDIAKDSVKNDSSLMTETLARVYLEQKKYDKAIQAFRILSLKYPEKSSFFADRIKAIEFLKNN